MNGLRTARWILAGLFFVMSAVYLAFGRQLLRFASLSEKSQIIPSAITVSIGAVLFWLVISFVYGRLYCSTVCPVGTLIDLSSKLRRLMPARRRRYRYRNRHKVRFHIATVYFVCLIAGISVVPALIEPWNVFRNIIGTANPASSAAAAVNLGIGAATGIVAGAVSLLLIVFAAVFTGREFCNTVCPVGTVLGLMGSNSVYRVEIDPDKCTGCLECEEARPAGCVKVVGRFVDDARCVRCMECVARCPENAIRYQPGRNRVATPMMRGVKPHGR